MQPTAASSPSLSFFTPAPVRTTRPTISWPGTHGYRVPCHSLRAVCRSEWQMPQYRMSMRTSDGSGARRSIVIGSSGASAAGVPHAVVVVVPVMLTPLRRRRTWP